MTDREKPHFSKGVIALSEGFQRGLGHSAIGGAIAGIFSGSSSPGAVRCDWYSGIQGTFNSRIHAAGDPNAGWLTRNWKRAVIMAITNGELEALGDQAGTRSFKQAVAYSAHGEFHVGVNAEGARLFGQFDEDAQAIAMRLGRGPLEATMGLWLPDEQFFLGAEDVQHVTRNRNVHVDTIGRRGTGSLYHNLSLAI